MPEENLTPEEKKYLLELARRTIAEALAPTSQGGLPEPPPGRLQEKRGAFVTLHGAAGQLRGCIGYVEAVKPLAQSVAEMALAAALRDPRFQPVRQGELDGLKIEISVLSPLKKISSAEEIEVGRHGLVIRRGLLAGLLLPQVATEYGWNREEFLDHTCLKAGLAPGDWKKPGTEIRIFSADVFGET